MTRTPDGAGVPVCWGWSEVQVDPGPGLDGGVQVFDVGPLGGVGADMVEDLLNVQQVVQVAAVGGLGVVQDAGGSPLEGVGGDVAEAGQLGPVDDQFPIGGVVQRGAPRYGHV